MHGRQMALRLNGSREFYTARADMDAFLPYSADIPAYAPVKRDTYRVQKISLYGEVIAEVLVHETVGVPPRLTIG